MVYGRKCSVVCQQKTDKYMPDDKPIKYILECLSDIGISRNSNQDACCARIICRNDQTIVMAAVCDGVGGLEDGEYASRSTIQFLNNWFDFFLSNMVMELSEDAIVMPAKREMKKIYPLETELQ